MDQVLAVHRGTPLTGDEEVMTARFTGGGAVTSIRIAVGYAFECSAHEIGATGEVTREEWRRFLAPTGYFEEVG